MKKTFLALTLFSILSIGAQNKWNIDKTHTSIRFEIGHMVISEVEGKFSEFEGEISSSKNDDFSDVNILFTINLKSVDTNDEKRDNHLQQADFFNTKMHPKMTFKSTSVQKTSVKEYIVKGNLTLRGVTKEITLNITHNGTIKDPFGSDARAGLKIEGKINREDFGIKYNKAMIGEIITFHCKTELTR
ncbi:YceI family protein [Polaribacter vadi]|uniref:YceI family protein n=1 Tax=Polaribacter TaxID=52959 RepID=UPI001C096E36|nr:MULTISPECIES: YceI family protein [Polaribacter]MBU3011960.1 YceI family protein [Polaribacter vadi]MDO6741775.1 YceI family protein [Polaribacter sp. 1_MG-2023]